MLTFFHGNVISKRALHKKHNPLLFLRFLSQVPETTISQSPILDFLITKCGLSSNQAISASNCNRISLSSTENPTSVLSLLGKNDFHLKDRIIPCVDLFENLMHSYKDVITAMNRCLSRFVSNVDEIKQMGFVPLGLMLNKVVRSVYRGFGFSEDEVLSLFRGHRRCMCLSEEKERESVDKPAQGGLEGVDNFVFIEQLERELVVRDCHKEVASNTNLNKQPMNVSDVHLLTWSGSLISFPSDLNDPIIKHTARNWLENKAFRMHVFLERELRLTNICPLAVRVEWKLHSLSIALGWIRKFDDSSKEELETNKLVDLMYEVASFFDDELCDGSASLEARGWAISRLSSWHEEGLKQTSIYDKASVVVELSCNE